jgi:hypothetical protein
LLWTSRSVRHLAAALREQGHTVRFTTVAKLLGLLGYSLQANVKTREGASHPDRDAQFEHINAVVKAAVAAGEPVISVDTKKKELVGRRGSPFARAAQRCAAAPGGRGTPLEVAAVPCV